VQGLHALGPSVAAMGHSRRLTRVVLGLVVGVLAAAGPAAASGGRYVFAGGTPAERSQVRAALDASRFDWDLVRAQVTIHIAPGFGSSALPGHVFLDADLLDAGSFAWGVVQHEYAHQVDFFLLDDARRARLAAALGGAAWWQTQPALPHAELTSERFASTLAWAYWPSRDNSMRPESGDDEAAAMAPAAFRTLLSGLLGVRATGQRNVRLR
jgi:hypothetical protein